ncbi:MAG TPA: hypothetical protein VMY98_04040, partial [Anaerolineae bacterium]|nr:hypothetical protein [Anaerolineae bacterium]
MTIGASIRSLEAGLNKTKEMMTGTAKAGEAMNSNVGGAFKDIAKKALGLAGITGIGAAIIAVGAFIRGSI